MRKEDSLNIEERERERKKYTQRYKNIYIIEERNVGYDIII